MPSPTYTENLTPPFDIDGDKVSGVTPSGLRKLKTRLSGGILTITG